MPACSRASQATSSSIRCCGSRLSASRGEIPKKAGVELDRCRRGTHRSVIIIRPAASGSAIEEFVDVPPLGRTSPIASTPSAEQVARTRLGVVRHRQAGADPAPHRYRIVPASTVRRQASTSALRISTIARFIGESASVSGSAHGRRAPCPRARPAATPRPRPPSSRTGSSCHPRPHDRPRVGARARTPRSRFAIAVAEGAAASANPTR